MKDVIYSINGPVVTVKDTSTFGMAEMVYVGNAGLIGEVISVSEARTTIQVYENTTGLLVGEPVKGTGAPLSATLGPGIMENIFDGIERPLTDIAQKNGAFIATGVHVDSLDMARRWDVTVTVKPGDSVSGGTVVATCPETSIITHKSMVPPDISGVVTWAAENGQYTVTDPICKITTASGEEKTICLAVSPALKAYGISGRARLFEVVQKVREVNAKRRQKAPGGVLKGSSCQSGELEADPALAVDYVVAPPQMARYMEISARIYEVYLKYIAPEDMHVYSIDEVFIDAAAYLKTYRMTARELAMKMILDVLDTTGITAAAGIGTNLYICKVAMDIWAKHVPADENGVRIAELDEMSDRRLLWSHRPLTDFWRVGRGYAKKLEEHGLFTMGDIARCSLGKASDYYNEDLLYGMFGVNAELLIDHAWGWEPCTIADIKAYKPESSSCLLYTSDAADE